MKAGYRNSLMMRDQAASCTFRRSWQLKKKEVIEEALRESQGRIFGPSGAAAKLGIARSTLESKIQSLNINRIVFKAKPQS